MLIDGDIEGKSTGKKSFEQYQVFLQIFPQTNPEHHRMCIIANIAENLWEKIAGEESINSGATYRITILHETYCFSK